MEFSRKEIELPRRKDKQQTEFGVKADFEKKENKKQDFEKKSNLSFKDYLKLFMLVFFTFFTCFYLWTLFPFKKWHKSSEIELIIAIFFLCITVKAWYIVFKKNVFKMFLEDSKPTDVLENEPMEFTEKEKRQLKIFVNCAIAFFSVLLIIDNFESGIIISIFLILTRKRIATKFEQFLERENNEKDS